MYIYIYIYNYIYIYKLFNLECYTECIPRIEILCNSQYFSMDKGY